MSHDQTTPSPDQTLNLLRRRVPVAALSCETAATQLFLLQSLGGMLDDEPAAMDCARSLANWAWQEHPLDPRLASPLLQLDRMAPFLPAEVRTTAKAVLDAVDPEAVTDMERDGWAEAIRTERTPTLLKLMGHMLSDPKTGPAWLEAIWRDLLLSARWELVRAALDLFPFSAPLAPIKTRLEAEYRIHAEGDGQGLNECDALPGRPWGLWTEYWRAELALRAGDRDQGARGLAALWKRLSWHTNLTLKLHDLVADDVSPGPDTVDISVLVYSWNKADLLAATLDSLAKSAIGDAQIFALDNGSSDRTGEVLREAEARFGADRFRIISLPVNVGAPAARNWLLSLPEVRERAWGAFLDDDVVLPSDWLNRLRRGAGLRPDAGAVGCRIIAASPPHGLQSGDYHIFPDFKVEEPGPTPIPVYENCGGGLDNGLFTYTRPCVSVSGCCHLVSLASIDQTGGFDIRFTPSQFDDLDRDLRAGLDGGTAYYVGDLAVRHVQHSSLAKAQTETQTRMVMANKHKLDSKYTPEEINRLATRNLERAWEDLAAKHAFLVDKFTGRP